MPFPTMLPQSPDWFSSKQRTATLHLIRLGFGVIALLFILVVGLAITRIAISQRTLDTISSAHKEHSSLTREMILSARERSFLLFSIIHEEDAFRRDEKTLRFDELGGKFWQARLKLLAQEMEDQERAWLEQQGTLVADLRNFHQKIIDLSSQGKQSEAGRLMLDEALPRQDQIIDILTRLIDLHGIHVVDATTETHRQQKNSLYFLIVGACLFVMLSFIISRFIYRRVHQMVDAIINAGDDLQSSNRQLEFQKFSLDQHASVSIADTAGCIIYANGLFSQISQYSPDELLGRDHRLLNSGYHPKEFFDDMWRTIASGKVWRGEIRNRKKNGDFYWVETTIVPFPDETGKPEHYVAIHTEVTAIKEAELMLQQGKARLEKMVEERTRDLEESRHVMQSITGAAQDAIAMIDDAGNTSYWNEAAEKLFGLTHDEVLGKNLHALIAPQRDQETYQHAFARFVRDGKGEYVGKTTELSAKHADGTEFPIEISLSALIIRGRWHGIGIMRDISERKKMEQLLREQATTDPLTGIHNRRKFDEFMALEQHHCNRYQVPFTLVLLDIDHFKQVNDTYGHPVGDAVLKELATVVAANIRNGDLFARWGGEEFAILASNCDLSHTRLLAEKLRHVIASHTFPAINKLTCSFGVAEYLSGESTEAFLVRVDSGLYRAKQQGRNRVEYI